MWKTGIWPYDDSDRVTWYADMVLDSPAEHVSKGEQTPTYGKIWLSPEDAEKVGAGGYRYTVSYGADHEMSGAGLVSVGSVSEFKRVVFLFMMEGQMRDVEVDEMALAAVSKQELMFYRVAQFTHSLTSRDRLIHVSAGGLAAKARDWAKTMPLLKVGMELMPTQSASAVTYWLGEVYMTLLVELIDLHYGDVSEVGAYVSKVELGLTNIFMRKNSDYGSSFRTYGVPGVLLRLGDKLSRLVALAQQESMVTAESYLDTVSDAANYCILAQVMIHDALGSTPTLDAWA